jgi:Arc/MetJ family transcription regulator
MPHNKDANLVIDHKLRRQALKATGLSSKKAVIEKGLRLLVKVHRHRNIRRLRGKIVYLMLFSIKKE